MECEVHKTSCHREHSNHVHKIGTPKVAFQCHCLPHKGYHVVVKMVISSMDEGRREQSLPLPLKPHVLDTNASISDRGPVYSHPPRTKVSHYVQTHDTQSDREETVASGQEVEEAEKLHTQEQQTKPSSSTSPIVTSPTRSEHAQLELVREAELRQS